MTQATDEIRSIVQGWIEEAEGGTDTDNYLGKRCEPRLFPWSAVIEVSVDGAVVNGQGINISAQGVGFVCKHELTPKTVVEIRKDGGDCWIPIHIQHCTQSVGSFKVGARFNFD